MSMFESPRLKLRERTGAYATGKARIQQILEAAYEMMIADGISAITLREIARRCGIRVGAVSYYYKSRTDLIQDLIECAVAPYFELYDVVVEDERFSAEQRLERLIRIVLEDIQTEKTTKLFPELWTLANRDPFVADLVDGIYTRQRSSFERLIAQINPGLGNKERAMVTLYVSASIEGQTMFVGYRKPHASELPAIENIAIRSVLDMVRTITNEDVQRTLPPLGDGPASAKTQPKNPSGLAPA